MQISVQNKTYSQLINNKYQQNLGYHISLRKLPKPTKKFIYNPPPPKKKKKKKKKQQAKTFSSHTSITGLITLLA